MDTKLIQQKQLVERYLLGRLTPPEARFFEQLIRKQPQLAEEFGLPESLKRTMKLLDDTGTEWREEAPRFWHDGRVPLALGVALLLATVLLAFTWFGKSALTEQYAKLQQRAEIGLLNAPTQTTTFRVTPARAGERVPTLQLGGRTTPSLAELRIVTTFASGNLYKAVIKREDGTFWARLDNLVRDSNGELRLGVNTGAFAAGTYDVLIEQVNLRGDGEVIGKLRLHVEAR
jgi:hypothetical protein